VNLTYTFSSPLSFTPTSSVVLKVTSAQNNPVFTHGVSFILTSKSYNYLQVVMSQTLSESPFLTGDVEVSVATIPLPENTVDQTADTSKQTQGYTFTYRSSSAQPLTEGSSSTYQVTFNFPVSDYYFQIREIQNTSHLQFVVGLVALASAVITGGSFLANLMSFLRRKWKNRQAGKVKNDKEDAEIVCL